MIKIYFAGSIRGGRHLAARYKDLTNLLRNYGNVYTEHVGDENAISLDNETLTDRIIHDRDMEWIGKSDIMVAEVSVPSLGVGYEIAFAITLKKPVLCLYDENTEFRLSAMISGSKGVSIIRYHSPEELKPAIAAFISENS